MNEAEFQSTNAAPQQIREELELISQSDSSILLTGETGTGKSYLSQIIHNLSPRRNEPYIRVSCGSLSTALIQSELFGHARGSFTGADYKHIGKFETVKGGTIMLDEIDCVPLEAQASLLRVLDDQVYEPVGSRVSEQFHGRVIAAANRPLDKLVAKGYFRSDLYYRLIVFEFTLPPLRDRLETIEPLANKFLNIYCERTKRSIDGITLSALEAMLAYHWPGNIRELRNTIERAATLCHGNVIDIFNLPIAIQTTIDRISKVIIQEPTQSKLHTARQLITRALIIQTLEFCNNNRTQAAKILGITRTALYKSLKRYGIMNKRSIYYNKGLIVPDHY